MSSFIPPPASTSNGKSSILELDYEGTQKLAEEKWFETPEAALPSPPQGKGKTKGGQGKQTRGYINSLRARSKRALQVEFLSLYVNMLVYFRLYVDLMGVHVWISSAFWGYFRHQLIALRRRRGRWHDYDN
eukprot:1319760-Amorphochlora_amoeboformis.AAC.1